jgi:hypothetical protein
VPNRIVSKAFFRIRGGRLDEVRKFFGTEALMERKVAIWHAGNRNTAPTSLWHALPSRVHKSLSRHGLRAPPARIQAMQVPLPVDQDKSIAAQTVHHGFGNVPIAAIAIAASAALPPSFNTCRPT